MWSNDYNEPQWKPHMKKAPKLFTVGSIDLLTGLFNKFFLYAFSGHRALKDVNISSVILCSGFP